LPGRPARQTCPADLPGRLARQTCPADLPGRLARQKVNRNCQVRANITKMDTFRPFREVIIFYLCEYVPFSINNMDVINPLLIIHYSSRLVEKMFDQ
jgi:hypothetical protein